MEDTSTCQGESLDITCKENQQALIIYEALFLRDGSGVCPYKNRQGLPENDSSQEIKCVDDVTDKIKSMCGWRKRCTITVNSDTLGGVCAGNYLTIRYSCGKITQKTNSGKCGFNGLNRSCDQIGSVAE